MLANILIKRRFIADKSKHIVDLLNQMRLKTRNQHGYVSDKTLTAYDNPQKNACNQHVDAPGGWVQLEK